jgi:DNA processing protein
MRAVVRFAHYPKMTIKRWDNLLAFFDSLESAWSAGLNEIVKSGWSERSASEFKIWQKNFDYKKAESILKQEDMRVITRDDNDYPPLLRDIYDPPHTLFIRGYLADIMHPLSIVGPRRNSAYGGQITRTLTAELVRNNITIVSGLALGIDAIAHRSALEHGGRTIAVLGGGINRTHIQPSIHRHLAEEILAHGGALISEYPPGFVPTKFTFPMRNRIVAGMTIGTLVTEAKGSSGAIITAKVAMDSGREVFAVPQNITGENSDGVHALIRDGATLVQSARDILEPIGIVDRQTDVPSNYKPKNNTEEVILHLITREPVHIDVIIRSSGLVGTTVTSTLMMLELSGAVQNTGGSEYIRL